ncbi:sensor histidine kinase [Leuconostoc rapi]|uniref:sensor histidine kinase n=1 Tax=Leuconostoc rapi TaxID=1406906 RepID=UPI001EF79C75|nr:sensor histidine kinase [Leuconostoc rapi]MBM7435930.1 NarL family two-component system sensor histidine kinase YdfH [Leuconostoc rapi]
MMYFLSFYLRTEQSTLSNVNSAMFFTVFFIQALVNFNNIKFINFNKSVYILLQIIIIIGAGMLISPGEIILYLSMLPVLSIQIMSLFDIRLKTLLLLLAPAQIIVIVIQMINSGFFLALMAAEASLFLNVVFFYAWHFYHQQVSQMVKTEHILQELQITYTEVKEISQQNERNRIGRDLHDTLMQGLAGVTMQLEGIKALLANGKIDRVMTEIDKTIDLSRTSLVDARTTVYEMRQTKTKDVDLYNRLDKLTKVFYENYGLSVNIKVSANMTLPQATLDEILRIISEALTNVVKHSKTDVAIVKISLDDFLNIDIIDYGVGFNVRAGESKKNHFGLNSIYERVEKLKGKVYIDSHVSEGTRIQVKIPQKLRWQND